MKKSDVIYKATERIRLAKKDLERYETICTTLEANLPETEEDFPCYTEFYGGSLSVRVYSKEELHKARTWLRSIFPSYTDELIGLFHHYEGHVFAKYCDKSNSIITCSIEWHFNVHNTPEEFTKQGCKWEERVIPMREFNFICPTKKE